MILPCNAVPVKDREGLDKRRAGNGRRRIPERTLHVLAFVGGFHGPSLRRQVCNKTKMLSFLNASLFVVVLHVAIVGGASNVFFGAFKLTAFVSIG